MATTKNPAPKSQAKVTVFEKGDPLNLIPDTKTNHRRLAKLVQQEGHKLIREKACDFVQCHEKNRFRKVWVRCGHCTEGGWAILEGGADCQSARNFNPL